MHTKLRHLLFYLLIASVVAMGISFSRFSAIMTNTGAESTEPGTEPGIEFSTWVLEHKVVEEQGFSLENMLPGDSRIVGIKIMNWKNVGEDVKVSDYNQNVELELETTGNLPLLFTLKENNRGNVQFLPNGPNRYLSESLIFTGEEQETRELELTMTWFEGVKGESYKHEIDYIQLRLKAVQDMPD